MVRYDVNENTLLEELIGLLETHGVKVRRESIADSTGGLCKINGEQVLFLNIHTHPAELLDICIDALGAITDIETMYLRPDIRQFIDNRKKAAPDGQIS
jgi:hypothetical protein